MSHTFSNKSPFWIVRDEITYYVVIIFQIFQDIFQIFFSFQVLFYDWADNLQWVYIPAGIIINGIYIN